MPIRRIPDALAEGSDQQVNCRHSDHEPLGAIAFVEPGLYEHICSGCGKRTLIYRAAPSSSLYRHSCFACGKKAMLLRVVPSTDIVVQG